MKRYILLVSLALTAGACATTGVDGAGAGQCDAQDINGRSWKQSTLDSCAWQDAGINDVALAQTWHEAGFKADEAGQLVAAGIDPEVALPWRIKKINVHATIAYLAVSMTPETSYIWIGEHYKAPMAAWFFAGGVKGPLEADAFARRHPEIDSFFNGGFSLANAMPWLKAGLSASDANYFDGWSPSRVKAFYQTACPTLDDSDGLMKMNPFAARGKCFSLQAIGFQLLDQHVGLYDLQSGMAPWLIRISFSKDAPPVGASVEGIAEGLEPYKYETAAGIYKIIPSLRMKYIKQVQGTGEESQ